MKKELFTEKGGISMTSAQYLSNLGQEKAKEAKEKLSNPAFYNTYIKLVDSGSEKTLMSQGLLESDLREIPKLLGVISKMNAFTAYCREAIKDKDDTLRKISRMKIEDWLKYSGREPLPKALSFEDWLEETGKTLAEHKLSEPEAPDPEEESLAVLVSRLGIDEYQRYLELDSRAAVLGKYVHDNDAELVVARRQYLEKLTKRLSKEGTGRDTCIYEYCPSVEKKVLEEVFESLQKEYREVSAKLNKMRFDLREAEAKRYTSDKAEYDKKLSEYDKEAKEISVFNKNLRSEWSDYYKSVSSEIYKISGEFYSWQVSEKNRVSKLKIIIPKALQETYEYLESLGKKEGE